MKIAFLDHHLDNWHAKVFLGLLRERSHDVVAFESHPLDGDWCKTHDVERVYSPEKAVAMADATMVLAPDDIDAHFDLSKHALMMGKPVFVDKLLAPKTSQALAMLALAESHETPLTCASSLRHAAELEEALVGGRVEEGFFSGYGAWDRYGVHTVAMALRVFSGTPLRRMANVGTPKMAGISLEWEDRRRALLVVVDGKNASETFPWRFALRRDDVYASGTVTRFDDFYRNQVDATLRAFEDRATMPRNEMIDAVRILSIAPTAPETGWVDLN